MVLDHNLFDIKFDNHVSTRYQEEQKLGKVR
jgi:hypothetical protein